MTRNHEKIRRRQNALEFPFYHDPLLSASRYVMRETEDMFQSIYMDIKEYWGDIHGKAVVRVYVMYNGKMYHSFRRFFNKETFDSMYKRDISPELYYRAVLSAEVFDLYVNIISKEDKKILYKGQV